MRANDVSDLPTTSPLVSIIVPVFNVSAYLPTCVDSILAQSHRNLEVVLVDDGSTDASGELCDDYARRDPRARAIHQSNQGLSVARNVGVAASHGEWVTFVDSDDWIDTSFISQLLSLAGQTATDAVTCRHHRVHDLAVAAEPPTADAATRVFDPITVLLEFLGPDYPTITSACGKLFNRALLEGIEFPPGRKHEDEFVTYRLLHKAQRTAMTSAALYYYRQRPGSIMRSGFDLAARRDALEAFRQRAEFFHEVGLGNIAYRPLLDEQLALWQHLSQHTDPVVRSEFIHGLHESVRRLRGSRQPLKFRLLAEAYLRAPTVADFVYRTYMRHHG